MIAGIKEIPIIIRDVSEKEISEISIIENIQREDLNPIEEALAYKALIDTYSLSQEEIANIVSKNRTTISNSLRLLKLSDRVQDMLMKNLVTVGQVRPLLAISESDQQSSVAETIIEKNLSAREVEKLLRSLNKDKKKPTQIVNEIFFRDFEEKNKNALGTKVIIHPENNQKGYFKIEYYNLQDFEKIAEYLTRFDDTQ